MTSPARSTVEAGGLPARLGQPDGIAMLDSSGKVPAAQLPGFVDLVVEFDKRMDFPSVGVSGTLYVAKDTGGIYRWSGSLYVEISPAPGSTDAVPEGSTNLYFTAARALSALSAADLLAKIKTVDGAGSGLDAALVAGAVPSTLGLQLLSAANSTTALSAIGLTALLGVANGIASLDGGGRVPAAQLPSFVDDVLEYATAGSFPVPGDAGKIYVALDSGRIYRWGGTVYAEISASPGSTDAVPEGAVNQYFTAARAQAAVTAADVLAKLKTVDGQNSGVDTDLVRGTVPGAGGLGILAAVDAPAVRQAAGLGTMSTQNAESVSIAGGTAILSSLLLRGVWPGFSMDKSSQAESNRLFGQLNGINLWILRLGDNAAHGGGNSGSNFAVSRHADGTGAYIDTPFSIDRATGKAYLNNGSALFGQVDFNTVPKVNGVNVALQSDLGGSPYKGAWNANTNTPTIASGVGTTGNFYRVDTAGSTTIDGVSSWAPGDEIRFNGTKWEKIPAYNLVTSVAGQTGAVALSTADISGLGSMAGQSANSISVTGGTATGLSVLGVGVSSPFAPVHVFANTFSPTDGVYYPTAIFHRAGNGAVRQVTIGQFGYGGGFIQGGDMNAYPAFNAMDLYLQPKGGKLGIGTTAPAALLDVAGDAKFSGPINLPGIGGNAIIAGNGDAASYATHNLKLRVHYGLGIETYDGSVQGYYDARAGLWDVKGDYRINGVSIFQSAGFNAAINAKIGAANGIAPLDSTGKVASSYLPSYVDDVLEYASASAFPATGEAGKIYVAADTNKTYRWSGSGYPEISASPGSTDAVTEGAVNRYFTDARVRGVALTGLVTTTNAAIAAGDTVLAALGKLQAQISSVDVYNGGVI